MGWAASPAVVQAESSAARADFASDFQAAGSRAVVGSGGASLLDAPGGALIRELEVGENLTALGRSADGLWMAVRTADDTSGWVATVDVLMFGAAQLPVIVGDRVPSGAGSDAPD